LYSVTKLTSIQTVGFYVNVELLWTGEDGTELSAAGQMETVLGVKGLDQV